MNVAITRAKNFLWVVGHAKTLNINKNWGDFVRYCFINKAVKSFAKNPTDICNILQDRVERISSQILEICKGEFKEQELPMTNSRFKGPPKQYSSLNKLLQICKNDTNEETNEAEKPEDGEIDPFDDKSINSQEVFADEK